MLRFPGPGNAVFLPHRGDAFGGAGGSALIEAALGHREQQRHMAHIEHPPSHPAQVHVGDAYHENGPGGPLAHYAWASRR